VIEIEACPAIADAFLRLTLAAIHVEMQEWRHSCSVVALGVGLPTAGANSERASGRCSVIKPGPVLTTLCYPMIDYQQSRLIWDKGAAQLTRRFGIDPVASLPRDELHGRLSPKRRSSSSRGMSSTATGVVALSERNCRMETEPC
jgi:hypothetical protein